MKNTRWFLVVLALLAPVAGCGSGGGTATARPTQIPQPVQSPGPTAILGAGNVAPAPDCPPARGRGTIAPDVSIDSITFLVNGVEQVVRADDTLSVTPGDQLQVEEISVCVGSFSGDGGEFCADLAPLDQEGQEIRSEHRGTHMMRLQPGGISIPGPGGAWTVDQEWGGIAAVVNHWPPETTQDLDCARGGCERDDRIVVEFR